MKQRLFFIIGTIVLLGLGVSCVSIPSKLGVAEKLAQYMPAEQVAYCFIDLQVHKEISENLLQAIGVNLKPAAFRYLTRFFAVTGDEGILILVEHRVPPFALLGELKKGGFQKISKTEMYHPESGYHAYFRERYLLEISQGEFNRGVSPEVVMELQEHTFMLTLLKELPSMIAIPLLQDSFIDQVKIFRDNQNRVQFDIVLANMRGSRAFVRAANILFTNGVSLSFLESEYLFSVSSTKENELTLLSEEIPDEDLIGLIAGLFETWQK